MHLRAAHLVILNIWRDALQKYEIFGSTVLPYTYTKPRQGPGWVRTGQRRGGTRTRGLGAGWRGVERTGRSRGWEELKSKKGVGFGAAVGVGINTG